MKDITIQSIHLKNFRSFKDETIEFSQPIEIARMKQSAYLTPGVTFNFVNKVS